MKNAKIYIIYFIVVLVLSYAFTYGMRIWQHNSRFKDVKPFLNKQFTQEKWTAGENLTSHDFGTFSMSLPDEDMEIISMTVLPNGTIIDPLVLVSTKQGAFKVSQPTSVALQQKELDEMKSKMADDDKAQSTTIRNFDSFNETLSVGTIGYFDFIKLDEDQMKDYIAKVNEKAAILQKAKQVVLFETDVLNGVMIQVEGNIKAKDSDKQIPFSNAEFTVWSKTDDTTQKFIVNGQPDKISSSIELIKKIIPTISYEGKTVQDVKKQVPLCLETIKTMEWFKFLKVNVNQPAMPEGVSVPDMPAGGLGIGN